MIERFRIADHGKLSSRLTEMHETWNRIRPRDSLPRRANFSPLLVPHLLPHIFMDDVLYDPLRFRFRLVGTEIVTSVGHDPTGLFRSDIQNAPTAIERLELVCETKAPIIGANLVYDLDDKFYPNYACLHLPFSESGDRVDLILSISSMTRRMPT